MLSSFPCKNYGAHLLSNLSLQFPEFDHHSFDVDGLCTLASLLGKPELQQASDPPEVAIDLAQVGHGLQINNRPHWAVQPKRTQVTGTGHARLLGSFCDRFLFFICHPNLYRFSTSPWRCFFFGVICHGLRSCCCFSALRRGSGWGLAEQDAVEPQANKGRCWMGAGLPVPVQHTSCRPIKRKHVRISANSSGLVPLSILTHIYARLSVAQMQLYAHTCVIMLRRSLR